MSADSDRKAADVEHILNTATRLFAAMGYDGTSARMIADAAGVSLEEVTEVWGDKRDLYVAVMERSYRRQRVIFEAPLVKGESTPEGMHELLDRYIDFCVERPEEPALWIHRWLDDAADITEVENLYVKPVHDHVVRRVTAGSFSEVDIDMAVWVVVWCVHGFMQGGVLDENGLRRGPEDPEVLRRFREHMHWLIEPTIAPS